MAVTLVFQLEVRRLEVTDYFLLYIVLNIQLLLHYSIIKAGCIYT